MIVFHRFHGRGSALGGWLLVLAVSGAFVWFAIAIRTRPETGPADKERPLAQIGRRDNDAQVWSLAFAPGTNRLAWATISGDVYIDDLATGGTLLLQQGPKGSTQSLAFSHDGRVLAVAGCAGRLWDVETGTELSGLEGGLDRARCIAFSRAGDLLAVGDSVGERRSVEVTVWNWEGRRRLVTLSGHVSAIHALAFSPDGSRLASGDSAGLVKLWDVAAGKERASLRACGSGLGLSALAISPDGVILVTASALDRSVRIWDAASGAPRGELPRTSFGVTGLAFSPDGTMLALACWDGTAELWSVTPPGERGAVRAQGRSFLAVAFSIDGRLLATGGMDGAVRLWDVAQILGNKPPLKKAARREGSRPVGAPILR
jgi:hypothetical protein